MASSWKLLASTTCSVSGVERSTWALSGTPMLPPTSTRFPEASSIRPTSVVVVDLPLVPVMAMTRPFSQRQASSSSPMTGTPAARASWSSASSGGTPGLVTIRSAFRKKRAWCRPRSSATPISRRRSSPRIVAAWSVSVTCAPRATSSSAAARPLRAAPTTSTRWPSTVNAGRSGPDGMAGGGVIAA